MITLLTGSNGTGKTAWIVQELTRLPSQRKIFVHGIPKLKIAHEPIYCKSLLCDLCNSIPESEKTLFLENWPEWATPGSLIVADEVQRIWGVTNSSSVKTDDISRLQTHRHTGLDFWLISQSPKLLNTGVRVLVGKHIHLVSRWSGRTEYEFPECRDNTESRSDAVTRPYKLPKKIFSLYRSASLHTDLKHRKPLALYFAAFIICLVAFIVYRLYDRVHSQTVKDTGSVTMTVNPGSTPVINGFPDFKPVLPNVPASAPAYKALIKVTSVPHLIGCVKTPDFCRCYTRQAVPVPVSVEFCTTYLKGGYFNPYRETSANVAPEAAQAAAGANIGIVNR